MKDLIVIIGLLLVAVGFNEGIESSDVFIFIGAILVGSILGLSIKE